MPGHTVPVKNEVKEYFLKAWGEMERGSKWTGYRIRTLQDDLGDGIQDEINDIGNQVNDSDHDSDNDA